LIHNWAMTIEYYNHLHQHIIQWMPFFVSEEHCTGLIKYFHGMLENLNGATIKSISCKIVEHVK